MEDTETLSLSGGPLEVVVGFQLCGQDTWLCREGRPGSLQCVVTTASLGGGPLRVTSCGSPEHPAVSQPQPQPRRKGSEDAGLDSRGFSFK